MTENEAIKKAIRHFECMKNDAVVVIDSGFGTHPGESDLVYRNRKMYAELAINALEKQMTKKVDKTEIEISKRKFATELKQLVHQKCAEINHYVSGCNSPFSYLQIADVQESLREIENTLNIKIKE